MTVPNQAINDLYQDGMYFQEVKIQTAYQMMTFCLNSLSKGLTSNTNSNSNSNTNSNKTEVETKNRKMVLTSKKTNTTTCLRPLKQTKF